MTASMPMTYAVQATNLSQASENRIHDDSVARTFGFAGGLVPGVEVYAYACHPAAERWGRAWLERGRIECRFLKPVYDGRIATVTATEADGGLALEVASENALCATGFASLPDRAGRPPAVEDFEVRPTPAERPSADETSLAPGTWLGVRPFRLTAEHAASYLRDIREADPIYAAEGLAHPGVLLRLCNLALRENVVLPPWIHTGSKVESFGVARIGDELSARARVAANYERKGHRLVDLDVLVVANGAAVARVLHTAIYRLRAP